ncbi:hypothetical protein JIN85_17200 [Luteolibacter pohnpeiensis]|uniref:Uncharacterized protein n=1 Tax=Luteolibacter pohnpeiensis TaxID=454153 RepID=A0A934SA34_9BACT|nr:hypothetical protein [Luteolibacter pohnpeiensis]
MVKVPPGIFTMGVKSSGAATLADFDSLAAVAGFSSFPDLHAFKERQIPTTARLSVDFGCIGEDGFGGRIT